MAQRETATLAAGCFWGVEDTFRVIPGVLETEVGYTGGETADPTYEDVCTDATGHAEAVRVTFDPSVITYRDLLEVFWNSHDPTALNRQGPDVGTRYRSAIFFHSEEQRRAAEASKATQEASGRYEWPIVTLVEPVRKWYRAKEYHQKYHLKRGRSCAVPFPRGN